LSATVTILKFGGTSVEDAAALRRVADIVRGRRGGRVVVVSAMSGVTDALLAAVVRAAEGDAAGAVVSLGPQIQRYGDVARELLPPAEAAAVARQVEQVAGRVAGWLRELDRRRGADPARRDAIVASGEDLAALVLTAVLAAHHVPAVLVDARRCVITDGSHGSAAALQPETATRAAAELRPLLAAGRIPVLGGFVGATVGGETTTLGRGGSDVTASLMGAALDAAEIQIWTDVPGVLTADPRVVPDARSIERLSYAEAAELAYFGAKVLHPRTIEPAVARGIPVRILDSRNAHGASTVVGAESGGQRGSIKSIAHKSGISVVQITAARMLGSYGFLHALFEVFARHRTVVDVVTTSEVSVSLTLEQPDPRPALLADLERIGAVSVERDRAIVCVVGDGLHDSPGIAARVFEAVREINVFLISQGASRVNLTFVVEGGRVAEVVRRVHAAVFSDVPSGLEPAPEPA
jgi:aspartate kinase